MPPELAYALRVNIEKLRPWEYDNMSFWQYERITHALFVFNDARAKLPPLTPEQQEKQYTQPLSENYGPQFPDVPETER